LQWPQQKQQHRQQKENRQRPVRNICIENSNIFFKFRTEESNDSDPKASAMARKVVVFEHFMVSDCFRAGGHSKTLLQGPG
jgi:hypothetical protein